MDLSTDITVALTRAGLDMAAIRQTAIANNIANASTPGFSPTHISFDAQLDALRQAVDSGRSVLVSDLPAPVLDRSAGTVALDMEMADMSRNAQKYQALAKLLERHFDLLSLAIAEGKK